MKDLRIVIVSWNVGDLLHKCLQSLHEACGNLDWECVVVDNASFDDSAEIARRAANHHGKISLIWNEQNLGFAKACNQGAAGADARYVLFLNPDTICPPSSIHDLVRLADERPQAGILGPKMVYPDGRYQPSVRRFPGVRDQVATVLKLQHLFPHLPALKRYLAEDFEHDKEQSVDQIMGACFLVRRELLDKGLGFDERYFIWMEEVDFCKTAKANGWQVLYLPQVLVVHHAGQSFAKEFHPKRQAYYLTSLKKYFAKWHPGWRSWLISALAPFGMAVVWCVNFLRTPVAHWSALAIVLEIVSALTLFHSVANSVFCALLGLVALYLGWKKPWAGLSLLLLELLIGSLGSLLQFGIWPHTVSLRVVMTLAFLLGWSLHFLKHGKTKELIKTFSARPVYSCLFAVLLFALIRGWLMHNAAVFKDTNAWADWLMLFPVLDIASRYGEKLRRSAVTVIFVGISWLALKTLGLEYLFSHSFSSIAPDAYLWVRRTGIGEVTLMVGNAYRIFMQSFVYMVAGVIMGASWWLSQDKQDLNHRAKKSQRAAWMIMSASAAILAISLSRSFWIGTCAGLVCVIGLLWSRHVAWWKKIGGPITAAVAGLLILVCVLAFPLPHVNMASMFDLLGSRTNLEEPAAASRWHLLPILVKKIEEHPILGSGFGATVTYQTLDPRIVKQSGGTYTTYAFEWGWLEHWIKLGILGIPLMLWILFSLGRRVWKLDEPLWLRVGAVSSLVAVATLHLFTPYLNHPLGFAIIFMGEGLIESKKHYETRKVADA